MKTKLPLLCGTLAAVGFALPVSAQNDPAPTQLAPVKVTAPGVERPVNEYARIQIQNAQGETLGRIKDLAIDLINGRVVEVLVASDSSLNVDGKIVAVPPLALKAVAGKDVYLLDVSAAVFKAAPGINLSKWEDAGRGDQIAAAYRHFGQEPYFLEDGRTDPAPEGRPKVSIGYVERTIKIMDLPVANPQSESFGKVWSLNFDILRGRILYVVVLAPGNFETKRIIPAMAFSFNAARDALVLDDTVAEFADEPRYVLTEAANGQAAHYEREPYQGQRQAGPLEQGSSYRDVDRTVLIAKNIRAAKLNGRRVEIGTVNGRVTLRGWAPTEEVKNRIGQIAIASSAAGPDVVDNQIIVSTPTATN